MAAKSKARSIRWQKTREINSKPFFGEKSPYWDWIRSRGYTDRSGEPYEFPDANPDVLTDPELQDTPPINSRALMLAAIDRAKLSAKEKAVLKCIGIEAFTEEETAKRLKISRRQVRVHLWRAQKKCRKILVAISRDSGHLSRKGQE